MKININKNKKPKRLNNFNKNNTNQKIIFFSLLITIILILLDIITKYIFTNKYILKGALISISYSKNYGSSFGIFENIEFYRYLIIILAIISIICILTYYKDILKDKFLLLATIFFISGVIGNTIDRIFFGYVKDFIALKYLFIFNFADFYITLSFIFFICFNIRENKSLKN